MVTFLHRKVIPRRAGVQMNTFCKTPRRRQATANYPPPGRRANYVFAKDSATPLGDYKLALNKILLPTFHHRKVTPRRVGVLTKPCKRLRPAEGEMKLCHSLCRQSLRHGCAVPPLFAQGRLWVYRQATTNLDLYKKSFFAKSLPERGTDF